MANVNHNDTIVRYKCPTKACICRIQQDLKTLYKDPLNGIVVVPDEDRVDRCHALIYGPSDTPYEFGAFYFLMEFPNDYPHNPPLVTLQSTGGVRFNPNLYPCGKVCLSILGTWSGPSWSPVQTIGSTLLSIQSLLNSNPIHNEPGFEDRIEYGEDSKHYNRFVRHETIRVAILDIVIIATKKKKIMNTLSSGEEKMTKMPLKLAESIIESFLNVTEIVKYTCDEYDFLDGRKFKSPYYDNLGEFQFSKLRQRIEELEKEFQQDHHHH